MRRIAASGLALAVLLAAEASGRRAAAAAEERKPLVIVSLSSHEKLIQDVRCVVDPRLTGLAVTLVRQVLGIPVDPGTLAPVGLDPRRPWGLVVQSEGQSFPVYGFVPVTDLSRLLAPAVAAGRMKPPVGGVYELKLADQAWHVVQKRGWAVFANSRAGLATAPADPLKVLGGPSASYDLAARVYPKNLPAEVRQVANRWVKERHWLIPERKPGETRLENALRTALVNQGLQIAASLADEGEMLLVGLSLDLRTRSLVLDLETTARPGTSTAESLGAPHKSKTDFGGFLLPQATLTGIWTGEIARMPLYRLLALFDSVASQLLPAGGKGPGGELWRMIRESLLEESVDGGVAAVVRPNGVTLLVGGYVPDGAKIQEKLKDLAVAARDESADAGAPAWKLDAARAQDVRLHTLAIPIPKDAQDRRTLVGMFGEEVEVVVGVGEHSLYVAAGKNPVQALKQTIQGSRTRTPRKQPPVQFSLALGPLARFLAETGHQADRSQAARIAALLEQSGGKDHVRLTARPVERGTHVRLEVEDGVLRSLSPAPGGKR